jgi:glycosyltransferase involved in cell wall biosynthesis
VCEEPLPYTVVESMLMGTMPVASRVGGVPEIVEGSPAEEYLFTPGDTDELADRIEALLSLSEESTVDAGMKLRKHVLRLFDKEKIEDNIVDLFSSLMS